MSFLQRILYATFPMINCNSANKDLRIEQQDTWNEIKQGQTLPDVQKFALIDKEDAQYLLVGIRDNITSLQDKAKVTAVAVTLAFSMVGGISSYMLNLKEKLYANGLLTGILVAFIILSCFYLISSGYFSLLTLNSKPKYDFSPDDFEYLSQLTSDDKKREEKLLMMGKQYKLISYQNTILNNYVDCSNNNLRNALISLGIFFSLICLSFALASGQQKQEDQQQTKLINEQSQMLKDMEQEIQTLHKELNTIKTIDKKGKIEIHSSIKELKAMIDKTLQDSKIQDTPQ